MKLLKPFSSILELLYPQICLGCAKEEPVHHDLFCHFCWNELPEFDTTPSMKTILESRFPLIASNSKFFGLYLFTKAGVVQKVLHKIKYGGRKDAAQQLGKMLGQKIPKMYYDAIIPVPIHKNKLRRRGYNQASQIAFGISETLEIPVYENILIKTKDTTSQTQMNRQERRMNITKAYDIKQNQKRGEKNILMVDDVVTTGATLDICTEKLKVQNPHSCVDYAFIAISV
jgi:ComF family protein